MLYLSGGGFVLKNVAVLPRRELLPLSYAVFDTIVLHFFNTKHVEREQNTHNCVYQHPSLTITSPVCFIGPKPCLIQGMQLLHQATNTRIAKYEEGSNTWKIAVIALSRSQVRDR